MSAPHDFACSQLERLRDTWFATADLAQQQDICRQMQVQALRDVPYIPLGQFLQLTNYRALVHLAAGGRDSPKPPTAMR